MRLISSHHYIQGAPKASISLTRQRIATYGSKPYKYMLRGNGQQKISSKQFSYQYVCNFIMIIYLKSLMHPFFISFQESSGNQNPVTETKFCRPYMCTNSRSFIALWSPYFSQMPYVHKYRLRRPDLGKNGLICLQYMKQN